jgi:hypothetical protein
MHSAARDIGSACNELADHGDPECESAQDEEMPIVGPAHRGEDGRGGEYGTEEPKVHGAESRVASASLVRQHRCDTDDHRGKCDRDVHGHDCEKELRLGRDDDAEKIDRRLG